MIAPRTPTVAAARMSSLRDFPFSFSADARDVLGSPDALNLAVRHCAPRSPSWAPAGPVPRQLTATAG